MKYISLLLFLLPGVLFAQNLDSLYVKGYNYSDNLKKFNKAGKLDAKIYSAALQLNSNHPKAYMEKARALLEENQFNEASFIFLLGAMRWRYYENFTHFTDEENSLKEELSAIINAFLRSNIPNFVAIIKLSVTYHLEHDYFFCSKQKKPLYYDEAAGFYSRLATQITVNEDFFKTMWRQERTDFEKSLKQ